MRAKTTLLIVFIFFASAIYLSAKEAREYKYGYDLNANGRVALQNVNGDVTIHGWTENRVEIIATKRGREEDFDLVEIEIHADANRIDIETKYPRFRNNVDVSVDYELKVPQGASLDEISNVNGSVDIDSVGGIIHTSSVNGSISVRNARSDLNGRTVNGSIEVDFDQAPQGSIQMESVNGRLVVGLPGSINADVDASSLNGSIETDFPVTVTGKFLGKKISGKIGSGGTRINLETVNGGIRITKAH